MKTKKSFQNPLKINLDSLLKNTKKDTSFENIFYKPSIIKEGMASYNALIKFLPWHESPDDSIVNKFVVWLHNQKQGTSRYVDCPSSVHKSSVLQDAFFACRNSDSASIQDLQKHFKRTQQFFSLIQIIEDKQHPELNGAIRIFQYGIQIYGILEEKLEPKSKHKEPHDFFDLFDGKLFDFQIKIKQVKKEQYPDYTASEFIDKLHGPIIDGVEKSEEDIDEIIEWLKKESPKLPDFGFKEWDAETKLFVAEAIKSTIPSNQIISELMKKHPLLFNSTAGTESEEIDEEKPKKKAKPAPAEAPKKTKKPVVVEEEDEDEDEDEEVFVDDDEDEDDDGDSDDLDDLDDLDELFD